MVNSIVQISQKEFQMIAELVYEKFGIHLTDKKISLVQGRLNKVLRRKEMNSFAEYFQALKDDASGIMLTELIDRISTNHTYFFREPAHFELLQERALDDVNSRLLGGQTQNLRLWCAGCATGEEAYTLAIVLREHFTELPVKPAHPLILATDISTEALSHAQQGCYEAGRLEMVPSKLIGRYFDRLADGRLAAKPALKNLILFRRLNFMSERFPFKNRFHIVFCRNVMIYFDQPTKNLLIRKFHGVMHDAGYLFIGHSESITRTSDEFSYIAPAAYQRRG